jgi:hypothetical protein
MPSYCTCGAELVPDALFCHRCGKPQREILNAEPEPGPATVELAAAEPTQPVPPPSAPAALDFHNAMAVRVAFLVAIVATLLSWHPIMGLLLWCASGWAAVLLYQRRTGASLSVRSGMRMGWITGVLVFALNTVVTSVSLLPAAANGGLSALFKQQIKNQSDPNVQEVMKMLDTAPGMVAALLVGLTMLFAVITILSMAGGALGAKFASRSR